MKWKIYFGFIVLLQIAITLDLLFHRSHAINIFIVLHTLLMYIETLGFFSYIFNKRILVPFFWKCLFWFLIVLESAIYLYAVFPQLPLLNTLQVFFLSVHVAYMARLVGIILEMLLLQLPILYVIYRLSEGQFYEAKIKEKKVAQVSSEKKRFQWGMVQMALWGYSSVVIFFFFIISLFPAGGGSDKTSDQTYLVISVITAIIFMPIFLFWLWVIIRFKKYKWNWWRTTLVANAMLYSAVTLFGVFSSQSDQGTSCYDFIGMLQLLILLISLYVFGRDQFYPQKKVINK